MIFHCKNKPLILAIHWQVNYLLLLEVVIVVIVAVLAVMDVELVLIVLVMDDVLAEIGVEIL